MAIERQTFLNKLDINVQNPSITVVNRVSYYEDGEEINRNHTETIYSTTNAEEIVSESQLVQDIWALVSGSEFVL
jgi:hypothetical protein